MRKPWYEYLCAEDDPSEPSLLGGALAVVFLVVLFFATLWFAAPSDAELSRMGLTDRPADARLER